jgi:hypothetical protein
MTGTHYSARGNLHIVASFNRKILEVLVEFCYCLVRFYGFINDVSVTASISDAINIFPTASEPRRPRLEIQSTVM